MAFSDATNSTHSYPKAHKSTPSNSGSPAGQDRRDNNVQFINEALTKMLLDCVRPTADPHVHSGSGLACTVRPRDTSCYEWNVVSPSISMGDEHDGSR